MLKNYLLTSIRILLRQKVYSGINVLGLTLGVTSALLILLYVADEFSYDRFHPDRENMYRLTFRGKLEGQDFTTTLVGMPAAEALQREAPQVSSVVRMAKWGTYPIRYEEKLFTEKKFMVADSNFFTFFNFKLVAGNRATALNGPNKVVITEATATKYFGYKGPGDTTPIGKHLIGGSAGEQIMEVTGIAENPPHQSHFHFDFVLSMDSWDIAKSSTWLNTATTTYFKLLPTASPEDLKPVLEGFVKKYCALEIQQFLNQSLDEFIQKGGFLGFQVQPMLDIHLYSGLTDELEPNGNIQYIYLFSAIAMFIVGLACINFMNLSTARSANRAKEIGIRKTIGAMKGKLVGQFILESFLYTALAFMFSIALVSVLLDPFNLLSGKNLTTDLLMQPYFIAGMTALMIIIGLLAGSYPAFYLTTFKPAEVLKGKVRAGMKSSGIRNTLVVVQFMISIALIISTLMVNQQIKFLQSKNLGFNKDHIIDLLHTGNLGKNGEAFKNELLSYPEIAGASYSNRLPPNIDWTSTFQSESSDRTYLLAIYQMDYDHLKTMGYEMAAGRFFSRDYPSDSTAVILNETAAFQLGLTDFEGRKLKTFFDTPDGRTVEVIGILKDFNFETLKSSIRPMAIMLGKAPNWEMAIRLTPGDAQEKISRIEQLWKKYAPHTPFEFSFLDQNFDLLFRAEQRLSHVILVFTSLAIIIACLGLFGLATFTAEQRSKEISIRKVMGATVPQVIVLLSKEFTKLVVIAFVIAIPITWYGMNQWLQAFAYRVNFSAVVVLTAGAIAVAVALFTISFQSAKAALTNPVNALRSE